MGIKTNGQNNLRKIVAVTVVILYAALVISRAAIVPLTMDEATSYLVYVRWPVLDPGSFFHTWLHSKGNNHLLNTFLMLVTELLTDKPYQEILIRMPSLISGILFAVVCGYLYCREKIGTTAYIMLAGNTYLLEFFALARGYGMGL